MIKWTSLAKNKEIFYRIGCCIFFSKACPFYQVYLKRSSFSIKFLFVGSQHDVLRKMLYHLQFWKIWNKWIPQFSTKKKFWYQIGCSYPRCQFHQHFTLNFFVYESVLQSFSIVTVWICNFWRKNIGKLHFGFVTFWEKDISTKAACKNVDEIDYRWGDLAQRWRW